jgi:hypothetical protein
MQKFVDNIGFGENKTAIFPPKIGKNRTKL